MRYCIRCNERMDEDHHLCRECIGDLVLEGVEAIREFKEKAVRVLTNE